MEVRRRLFDWIKVEYDELFGNGSLGEALGMLAIANMLGVLLGMFVVFFATAHGLVYVP